jgi:Leucine-rich repeat (LRR) protein
MTSVVFAWSIDARKPLGLRGELKKNFEPLTVNPATDALDLAGNELEEVPTWVFDLANLRALSVRGNRIKRLHKLGLLRSLEYLDLDNNHLKALPTELFQLTRLRYLSLDNNRIPRLPDELASLNALETLDIGNNRLAKLPEAIGSLVSLTSLDVGNNRLSKLPASISNLSNLTIFQAECNSMTELPAELGHLRALKHLNVAHNRLSALPESMCALTNLQSLNVAGNSIRRLPEGTTTNQLREVTMLSGQPKIVPLENLEREWDVFISHASEDKTLVDRLARVLTRAGLRVWIDSWQIRVGDRISASVDEGLRRSRFGVLLLSPAYLGRYWTMGELEALSALEASKKLYLLPVWHNLQQAQVLAFSPMLAGRRAADTADGVEAVAAKLVDAIFYRIYELGGEEISPIPGLVQVIHGNPHPQITRDFLLQYRALVYDAAHCRPDSPCQAFEEKAIVFTEIAGSLDAFVHTTVWFHPPNTVGFTDQVRRAVEDDARRKPPTKALRKELLQRQGGSDKAASLFSLYKDIHASLSLVGRRSSLSPGDRKRLSLVNEKSRWERVRTYDYLLDVIAARRENGQLPR